MSNVNSVLYRTQMLDANGLVSTEWIRYFDTLGRSILGYVVAGNNLSDLTNIATARTNLGLGSAALLSAAALLLAANNLSDVANAATARTNLGLGSAATHAATDFQTSGASLQIANNLSDVNSAATSRANLAVPGLATSNTFTADQSIAGAITGALGGWQTYSPTVTPGSPMTASSLVINDAQYLRIGPLLFIKLDLQFTLGGTATNNIEVSLPVAIVGPTNVFYGSDGSADPLNCRPGFSGSGSMLVSYADSAVFSLGTKRIFISSFYRVA